MTHSYSPTCQCPKCTKRRIKGLPKKGFIEAHYTRIKGRKDLQKSTKNETQ